MFLISGNKETLDLETDKKTSGYSEVFFMFLFST